MTLPNVLTLGRMLAVPLFFALWLFGEMGLAVLLLGVGLLTDFFDGVLARRLNQVSPLGGLLDPAADKLVVLTLFPFFYGHGLLPWWLCAAIVLRNLSQLLSIPILISWLRISFKVKPKLLPKVATTLSFCIAWVIPATIAGGAEPYLKGKPVFQYLLQGAFVTSACLELYILATFLPRFYQIATRAHDTFE